MPVCPKCGLFARGPRERCEKCGSRLPGASVRREEALEAAVRQADREFSAPAAPRRRPGAPRLAALGLLVLVLLWAGVFLARTLQARNSVPFAPGDAWRFAVRDLEGAHLLVTVGEEARLEGRSGRMVRVEMEEGGQRTLLGFGYGVLRLRGLDLVAVEQAGSPAPEVGTVRLLPFPYGPGSAWTSKVRGSWAERVQFLLDFQAGERESVRVPAGTFQALPVRFELKPPVGPVLLAGSFALAPGVGPVRFQMDVPGQFRGLRALTLELEEFRPAERQ